MVTNTHISADDFARYRAIIADMNMNDKQKDDVIRVVHGIMQAFVDISHSNDAVQISRKTTLAESFRACADCANLVDITENKTPITGGVEVAAGMEP